MSETPPAKVEPYIPASKSLPELTVGVVILGCLLSVILGAANAYLGMFAGMTVSASVPAAVISMAVLRFVGGNILQNNVVQTAAASGASIASGVIFTLPALLLLGEWANFHFLETALIASFGGVLGVLFTIPLRRAMIIDQPLQFPEGIATAEVLKVGAEGGGGVGLLVVSALFGAIVKVGATGMKIWAEIVEFATFITGGVATAGAAGAAGTKAGVPFAFGINASPALVAVGYIVGFNVALVIFAGAVLNRWIAIPLYAALGDPSSIIVDPDSGATLAHALLDPDTVKAGALGVADTIRGGVTRYLGVGGMLVGGLWSLFKLRKSLLGGVRAGLDAYRQRKSGSGAVIRTEHDMPMNVILILIAASVIPLFFLFFYFTESIIVSAVMAVLMVIAGFLFSAVSAYMAGLVGSSNNPISGITISTILVASGLLVLLQKIGVGGNIGPVAAILIGSVVCCAAAIGGDNLQDLKCGYIVGSTPWKQQTMQIVGVIVAAMVVAPVLNVLHESYTIGSKALAAPQANLMATVSKGVFAGGLPWKFIGFGAAIAVVVIALDVMLEKRKAKFRIPVMAFAVGVYLPFDLNVPIFFGGLIAWLVNRHLDKTNATEARRSQVERNGFLVAAGFITGESLMGIGIAIPIAATKEKNWWVLGGGEYADFKVPGLVIVAVVMALLYVWSLRDKRPSS